MIQKQNKDSLLAAAGGKAEPKGTPSLFCGTYLGPHVSTVPRNKPDLARVSACCRSLRKTFHLPESLIPPLKNEIGQEPSGSEILDFC